VAPNFAPLRTAIEEVRQTVRILLARRGAPAAEEPEPAQAEAEAVAYYDAPAEQAAPPRRRTEQAEPADQEDAVRRIASVAAYLRRESPYSPVPFLLLRGLRWGELRANGATLDESLLEPPPAGIRQNLKRLALGGQWEEVLNEAESAMGWLAAEAGSTFSVMLRGLARSWAATMSRSQWRCGPRSRPCWRICPSSGPPP